MVNMEHLILGLTLVVVGMAITFIVLIILSGVIHYFGKFIKKREDKNNLKKEKLETFDTKVEEKIEASDDNEIIAMITAAYFHISKDAVSLLNLHSKPDNWKILGRREQMEML